MARDAAASTVLPHRPIDKLSSRIWRVEGDLPNMPLKRVMTIARRDDGDLVLHNAITLEDALMKEIEAFGRVAFIVVPNGYHRLDAAAFAARYPDAKVLCPPGARAKVEKVVRVDGVYSDMPADGAVTLALLDGLGEQEGVMTVRDETGASLVFNDAVFNTPHFGGLQGFILKHVTGSTGGPRVTRVARLFIVKNKRAFADHLRRLADTEGLARVIVSHHEMITDDPAATLRAVAATL